MIKRFEDIKAWQLARELCKEVYSISGKPPFSRDYGLKDQVTRAAGSIMHNIAEGFDADTNRDFIRFLVYAKRSCCEVQSELYIALDQNYIERSVFCRLFEKAAKTRAVLFGFICYLKENTRPTQNF